MNDTYIGPNPINNSDLGRLFTTLSNKKPRIIELQKALSAIIALSPENGGDGELDKAEYIESLLKNYINLGLDCNIYRSDANDCRIKSKIRPNIIAKIKGKKAKTLWLFGHMDVVPPGDINSWNHDPWQVHENGDFLIGRGVEDNQQAIVCMLILCEALLENKIIPEYNLGLVFMSDEECGSHYGLEYVLNNHAHFFSKDDFYIIPDAGSKTSDSIEIAEKAQLWVKIKCIGIQCHASTPDKGKNAFVAACDMGLCLHKELPKLFPLKNELFSPPVSTFVLSRHEENVSGINILPGQDIFYIDCRLIPTISISSVVDEIKKLAEIVEKRQNIKIEISVIQSQNSTDIDRNHKNIKILKKAISYVYNTNAKEIGIGGATVAAFLRQKNLPAIVWATIENTCHQPNERSSITATIKDSQVFAHILMDTHND